MAKKETVREDGLPVDFENWETEKLGDFPPYWSPATGDQVYAKAIGVDYRDPEFRRIILEAQADTECLKGPKADAETVLVPKGEVFTMSEYALVSSQIGFLIQLGIPFVLKCGEEVKSAKNPKQSYFQWELKMAPESRKALQQARVSAALATRNGGQVHNAVPVAG